MSSVFIIDDFDVTAPVYGAHGALSESERRQAYAARRLDMSDWDESKHPREPAGSPEGGQFTSGSGPGSSEGRWDRRDDDGPRPTTYVSAMSRMNEIFNSHADKLIEAAKVRREKEDAVSRLAREASNLLNDDIRLLKENQGRLAEAIREANAAKTAEQTLEDEMTWQARRAIAVDDPLPALEMQRLPTRDGDSLEDTYGPLKMFAMRQGFEGVRRMVSKDVLTEVLAYPSDKSHIRPIIVRPANGNRSSATANAFVGPIINMAVQQEELLDTSTIHEIGHIIEGRSPKILEAALAFRDRRASGSQIPLSYAEPAAGYQPDEVTVPDKFIDAYVGKAYDGNTATEIISMGLQFMYSDPIGFARKDPDHFGLIYEIMRGRPYVRS